MVQSVSKTYQAHTSTNGSLIITSNIQRPVNNSKNENILETSEKFRKMNTRDRVPKL